MTEEDTSKLKSYLTSEMVSSITLAEAINIMHSLAAQEVERNIEEMSDDEKSSALQELQSKVEEAPAENRKGETKE
jgi:Mg/Co/Ni transporter MgtE